MWVPYINGKKEDWDILVEENYQISTQGTKIEWKYEHFAKDI
jgi:hypothetical protein